MAGSSFVIAAAIMGDQLFQVTDFYKDNFRKI